MRTRRVELQCDHGYQYSGVLPADWLTAGELSYSLEIHTGGGVRQLPDSSQPDSKDGAWHVSVLTPEAPAVIFQAARDRAKPWGSDPFAQRLVEAAEPGQQGAPDLRQAIRAGTECGFLPP